MFRSSRLPSALALVGGLALGLAPAMHSRLSRLTDALKESTRGGSGGVRSGRLRATLVVAEVAMAIILFIGAGLMIRSGQKLSAIDPGFDPAHVLLVNVGVPRIPAPPAPPPAAGRQAGQPAAAGQAAPPPPPFVMTGAEILERVGAVPGVMSAALASDAPLDGNSSAAFYSAEGDSTTDAQTMPRVYWHRVSPSFFETLRIPVTSGRIFQPADATPDGTAVIVSDNIARRFWPNEPAIGKRIKLGAASSASPWLTIVGTVGETKYRGLPVNPTADPDLYLPALDRSPQAVLIRTSGDPAPVLASVRAAIRRDRPSVVVFGDTTLTALVDAQTSAARFTTWILGIFAAVALLLSVIGIYGVMSYLVAQRTREFAIRLALGASRAQVIGAVLRHGTMLVAAGTVLGVAITAALYRLFRELLFDVAVWDAAGGIAVLTLAAVAIVACLVPAIRATRVEPVVALRG